jgi:hypothetical protein
MTVASEHVVGNVLGLGRGGAARAHALACHVPVPVPVPVPYRTVRVARPDSDARSSCYGPPVTLQPPHYHSRLNSNFDFSNRLPPWRSWSRGSAMASTSMASRERRCVSAVLPLRQTAAADPADRAPLQESTSRGNNGAPTRVASHAEATLSSECLPKIPVDSHKQIMHSSSRSKRASAHTGSRSSAGASFRRRRASISLLQVPNTRRQRCVRLRLRRWKRELHDVRQTNQGGQRLSYAHRGGARNDRGALSAMRPARPHEMHHKPGQ